MNRRLIQVIVTLLLIVLVVVALGIGAYYLKEAINEASGDVTSEESRRKELGRIYDLIAKGGGGDKGVDLNAVQKVFEAGGTINIHAMRRLPKLLVEFQHLVDLNGDSFMTRSEFVDSYTIHTQEMSNGDFKELVTTLENNVKLYWNPTADSASRESASGAGA